MPGEIPLGTHSILALMSSEERKALAQAVLGLSSEYGWRAVKETVELLWNWHDEFEVVCGTKEGEQ